MKANMVQKAALYPSNRASEAGRPECCFVTRVETTCMIAKPIAFPNCDAALKTDPATACLSSGKVSVTTMRPTVKRTSAENGMRTWAKNAAVQYVQVGLIRAMRSGETAVRTEVVTISQMAGIL